MLMKVLERGIEHLSRHTWRAFLRVWSLKLDSVLPLGDVHSIIKPRCVAIVKTKSRGNFTLDCIATTNCDGNLAVVL